MWFLVQFFKWRKTTDVLQENSLCTAQLLSFSLYASKLENDSTALRSTHTAQEIGRTSGCWGEGHPQKSGFGVDSSIRCAFRPDCNPPPPTQRVPPRGCCATAITGFLAKTSDFFCFWKFLLGGNDFATEYPSALFLAVLQTWGRRVAMAIFFTHSF